MEVWKEVYGFNVLYEISNLGRVRTKYSPGGFYTGEYVYLSPSDNGHGYQRFNWSTGKTNQTVYVHKLVAQAFIPNPNGYDEVNHKDENKSNNASSNLEWCSHRYNAAYGTRNIRASEKRCVKVECVETGVIYNSVKEAAVRHGVGITAISNCLNGRAKSCAGKTWRRVNVHA